jgi:motility quorum-sensing regulator/GCU-specific mRNA interferase toxin
MVEKRTPHHDLAEIKTTFAAGKGLYTRTATRDAAALGCDRSGIDAVIQTVSDKHFYKSMTANHNAGVWQDVYHPTHNGMTLYVKFTDNGCVTEFTLLSFKEK